MCDGMMRHAASSAAWTAPGEVWEYVSQLVSSYHDQHDCQYLEHLTAPIVPSPAAEPALPPPPS
ncbi:hypothetical protein KGM_208028 [Danaus plexippus plexippus]|uniref:Uncharacterized protein n=1 Tax=Danaus plexippus plexippus TaxID=278856 RepID=A0A212ESA6_DANPL|nr:hypothetical protein KGM_208028 [Danaus plexippus plexippus]